jgi:hypothetical protein
MLAAILGCQAEQVPNTGGGAASRTPVPTHTVQFTAAVVYAETTLLPCTPTPLFAHQIMPTLLAVADRPVYYDVESAGAAAQKRAPDGDLYDLNRLERPFLQDMTYVPDLDISSFMLGQDADWIYVSISLVGDDPNSRLDIDYGVELDVDHDGFGDYLIWARPPYPVNWSTSPVQIYQDKDHDTGGLNPSTSEVVFKPNGYEKLIFNGGGVDTDPDMAWMRVNNGVPGSVQFAFKRSWLGSALMLGVLADAGFRDPGQLDYVDRMTIEAAGSPLVDSGYYPLKGLFAVDNVCRAAFGFVPTGTEPQLCPAGEAAPRRTSKPPITPPPPDACQPDLRCPNGWDYGLCQCIGD